MTPMIVFDDVRLSYGSHVAVDGATLGIAPGTLTTLIGPNGSGKSTMLDAVAGLTQPAHGRVTVGEDVTAERPAVAYVMQHTARTMLPITAEEVVRMGCYGRRGWFGRLTGSDHANVTAAMARLGVTEMAGRQLRELSGGERQRVLIAQGLVQQAPILLLDEPVTGLDIVSRRRIGEVVDEERDAGRTVLVSTHDLRDAERADQVVLLATQVVACGPPAEVLTAPNLQQAYGGRFIQLTAEDVGVDEHVHQPHS